MMLRVHVFMPDIITRNTNKRISSLAIVLNLIFSSFTQSDLDFFILDFDLN